MNTNTHRDRRPQAKGFSLIELLLVLVILATLAAIVIPKFTNRSKEARNTAAQTDISNIETSLDAFEIDCGRYPTEQEGLNALVNQPDGVTGWKSTLTKLPKDPWGNPYIYRQPGRHNTSTYDLSSSGPNLQEGDDDDICNWSKD